MTKKKQKAKDATASIRALQAATRHQPPVLFLGAGFSLEAGYASVEDLKQALVRDLVTCSDSPREVLMQTGLDTLAEMYQAHMGNVALNGLVRTLYAGCARSIPRSYDMIKRHTEIKLIITTNYDDGLCKHLGIVPSFLAAHYRERLHTHSRVILHLHGHVDWLSDHRVLTSLDYATFYDTPGADSLADDIVALMKVRALVFVGYGLNDGNVKRLFTLLPKRHNAQVTVWVVSPDADTVLKNNQNLAVNIRPINLKSSEFFETYGTTAATAKSLSRASRRTGAFAVRRDRLRHLLRFLLSEIFGNPETAEEVIECLFDERHGERNAIQVDVSVGNDSVLVVPERGKNGHWQSLAVQYGVEKVDFNVDATPEETLARLVTLQGLVSGRHFGLAWPVSRKKGQD